MLAHISAQALACKLVLLLTMVLIDRVSRIFGRHDSACSLKHTFLESSAFRLTPQMLFIGQRSRWYIALLCGMKSRAAQSLLPTCPSFKQSSSLVTNVWARSRNLGNLRSCSTVARIGTAPWAIMSLGLTDFGPALRCLVAVRVEYHGLIVSQDHLRSRHKAELVTLIRLLIPFCILLLFDRI